VELIEIAVLKMEILGLRSMNMLLTIIFVEPKNNYM
jgi:hypothetical protein